MDGCGLLPHCVMSGKIVVCCHRVWNEWHENAVVYRQNLFTHTPHHTTPHHTTPHHTTPKHTTHNTTHTHTLHTTHYTLHTHTHTPHTLHTLHTLHTTQTHTHEIVDSYKLVWGRG